jgi:uncharacterized coiled-coil protein SlyX
MKVFDWVKNNLLTTFLLILVVYLLLSKNSSLFSQKSFFDSSSHSYSVEEMIAPSIDKGGFTDTITSIGSSTRNAAVPQSDVADRMVVQTSNISMVVDDVRQKMDQILDHVDGKGGYMVSSSLNQPQEAPFANLVVRVPSDELRPTLEFLRGIAIKVTSENLKGRDVTDQYMDVEARITTLEKTKAKFEEILNKAEKVDEILRVQREVISLQTQIDSLMGQQQYLEKTSENAKLTIYMSTDEWSLPYAPEEPSFRPKVIFKQAVRSLVQTLRGLANKIIWVGVYSVVWLPILLVYWWWRRKRKSRQHELKK